MYSSWPLRFFFSIVAGRHGRFHRQILLFHRFPLVFRLQPLCFQLPPSFSRTTGCPCLHRRRARVGSTWKNFFDVSHQSSHLMFASFSLEFREVGQPDEKVTDRAWKFPKIAAFWNTPVNFSGPHVPPHCRVESPSTPSLPLGNSMNYRWNMHEMMDISSIFHR